MNIFKNIFTPKKETNDSKNVKRQYFKILNFNYFEGQIDSERFESMKEYAGEYNYELNNEYFENTYFYSYSDLEQIQFEVFFTSIGSFRNISFYKNYDVVQDFFLSKYNIPFFYQLSNDEQKKKYDSTFHKIGDFLRIEDFVEIILPNIKFKIILPIELNKLKKDTYYVFYNWNFYEEIQISPNSNSFLRFITTLPYDSRKNNYLTEAEAKTSAFNALLENACSTVDTTLRGLFFDLMDLESMIFSNDSYGASPKIVPSIRSLDELDVTLREDEMNKSLKFLEKQTMNPFKIIKTANTM